MSLASYFTNTMKENHLVNILDAPLKKDASIVQTMAIAHLAKRCLNNEGKNRPPMEEVAFELGAIKVGSKDVMISFATMLQQNFEEIKFDTIALTKGMENYFLLEKDLF